MNNQNDNEKIITYFLENGILPQKQEFIDYIRKTYNIEKIPDNIMLEVSKVWNQFASLEVIKPYLEDNSITELIIHSHDLIHLLKGPSFEQMRVTPSVADWNKKLARYFSLKSEQFWSYSSPFKSFYFEMNEQKYRVTLLHDSLVASNETKISIRKHYAKKYL